MSLLKPLIDAGLVPADYPMVIHAVSGYSGRGRIGLEEHKGAAGAAVQNLGLMLGHTGR